MQLGKGVGSADGLRSSQPVEKTARQKALDKLKRARSGRLESVSETVGQEDDPPEEEHDGLLDESAGDEETELQTTSRDIFRENEDDEDFVEEDDEEATLGIPEIPIEFTSYASMKPKALFKFAVEWMVQKKINPAFRVDDAIYTLAFNKLDCRK